MVSWVRYQGLLGKGLVDFEFMGTFLLEKSLQHNVFPVRYPGRVDAKAVLEVMSKTEEMKTASCSLLRADHLQKQDMICWFRPMVASNLDDSEVGACSQPAPRPAAAQPTILRVRLGRLASSLGLLENLCASGVFGT